MEGRCPNDQVSAGNAGTFPGAPDGAIKRELVSAAGNAAEAAPVAQAQAATAGPQASGLDLVFSEMLDVVTLARLQAFQHFGNTRHVLSVAILPHNHRGGFHHHELNLGP